MVCQECRQRPASVHLTKIINGLKSELHLCEVCAKEKGQFELVMDPGFSIHNLLAGLLNYGGDQDESTVVSVDVPHCSRCGVTWSQFAQTGRMGCSRCYEEFEDQVTPLIRRIHGGTQHTGKAPQRTAGTLRVKREIARLKEDLQRAVIAEEFEKAVQIRDKIRGLERQAQ